MKTAWMLGSFALSALLCTNTVKASELGGTQCDAVGLEKRFKEKRQSTFESLTKAIADNETYAPDLTEYINLLNEFNSCLEEKGFNPLWCASNGFKIEKELSPYVKFQRYINVREVNGTCVHLNKEIFYLMRNLNGQQFLTYQNGHFLINEEHICKSNDGVVTGRGFVLNDGIKTDRSNLFVVDFGIPLENFLVSQFWGISYPVGNKRETLKYNVKGEVVTLQWGNGAKMAINSKTQKVESSNFVDVNSFSENCITENDGGPGNRRKYWPNFSITSSGQKYMGGDPEFIKGF